MHRTAYFDILDNMSADAGRPLRDVRGERVLTRPLLVCLLMVSGILLFAAFGKWSTPTFQDAVRELADGDLDGPERPAMLRVVIEGAAESEDPGALWAGMLAAVALDDRTAFNRARARLGPGPAPAVLPVSMDRTMLHLGDPMLDNLSQAISAEAAADSETALRLWLQVQAQCRLVPRPLAAALVDEALKRLK